MLVNRHVSGSGNYRRIPKYTESYRRLPKAGLKIEYRPNVSGVVANLELGNAWGQSPQQVQGWSGGQGAKPPEAS